MCNTKMCRGRRKGANVYFAAAVILMCYLAQTIDCYRLRKTERREGRREAEVAKTKGVQEGRILFGTVFQTESQDLDGTKKSNASVEDEAAYQADSTGWLKGQTYDTSSKEASWNRMAPSLQCGGDQLKFRAVGPGASYFVVEQGAAPPTPLSQVPSTCGYNMQRNSLGLVMLVPYNGCNMVQEAGSYVLPMRWQGVPVSLWCPKPASPAAPDHHEPQMHQVPQTSKIPDDPHHKDPPAPVSPYYWYPGYPNIFPFATAAPTTAKPATAPPPKMPVFNPAIHLPWILPPHAIPTTTAATTTTTAKPQIPPIPPYFMPFPPPYHPLYPPVFPTAKPQTTTKPTTTTKQTPPPHVHPPFPFPYHPLFPLVYPTTKPQTTTKPTTTTKQTPPPHTHLHVHPPFPLPYHPLFPLVYPTAKPQTTTKPTTTTKQTPPPHTHAHVHPPILPPFPLPYHPLFPPLVYPTAKPTTTTTKAQPHPHPYYYYFNG